MINQEDMFGKFLPNIYIDRITLESSEISELKVGLDLSIKYERDNDPISLWFSNDKFKKYIKIKVIQSINPILTKEITNKTQHISDVTNQQAIIRDLTIANAIAETDNLTKYSHTDSDGSTIMDVNFRTNFVLGERNPEHLTYFIFATLDLEEMKEDFGTLEFDKNILVQNGRISSEIVIDSHKTIGMMTEFYTQSGVRWDGSVHKMPGTEIWMTDPSHSSDSEYLTVQKVPNNKIQDFRHVEDIKRYSVDLSVLSKQALAQNKFRSLKSDNMEPKSKEAYFSNIYLTKDMNNNAKFMFAVDYKKLLMDTSVFKKLYETPSVETEELIKYSRIRSLSVKRRRVIEQETKNKLGTPMIGEVLFDSRLSPETILTSSDRGHTSSFIEVKEDDSGIREQSLSVLTKGGSSPPQFGIRFFSAFDKKISRIDSGLYQYGIEITVEERTATYLKEKLDKLILARKNLHAYSLEGTKLGMTKYLAEVVNPHIDSSWEHAGEVVKSSGNYNPTSNRFTEEFISRLANLIDDFDLGGAVDTYSNILNLLTPRSMSSAVKKEIYDMIKPDTGNPKSVQATINLFDDLISKLNNLIGLDSDSKTLLSSTTTVEYWFKNNEFDASKQRRVGYDYLSSDKKYRGSDYVRELTTAYYSNRVEREYEIYFKLFKGNTTIPIGENIGFAYLSPNFCHFNSPPVQIRASTGWIKHSILASRIMNYNFNKRTDIPQGKGKFDKFKSSITSIYADLGLTIELTDGRKVDEDTYPNGLPISEVIAPKLYKSLMVGFMKSGASNKETNENPFRNTSSSYQVTKSPSDAGIKVWNSDHQKQPWNIANNSESKMKQILLSCRDESGIINQDQVIKSLPNQLKSLMSPMQLAAVWNPHDDPSSDPTKDLKSPFFHFRYNQINAIEYLVGFEDGVGDSRIKNPIWKLLTRDRTIAIQGSVMCRMREFECPAVGVQHPKGLKLPVYDNYFILRGGN